MGEPRQERRIPQEGKQQEDISIEEHIRNLVNSYVFILKDIESGSAHHQNIKNKLKANEKVLTELNLRVEKEDNAKHKMNLEKILQLRYRAISLYESGILVSDEKASEVDFVDLTHLKNGEKTVNAVYRLERKPQVPKWMAEYVAHVHALISEQNTKENMVEGYADMENNYMDLRDSGDRLSLEHRAELALLIGLLCIRATDSPNQKERGDNINQINNALEQLSASWKDEPVIAAKYTALRQHSDNIVKLLKDSILFVSSIISE